MLKGYFEEKKFLRHPWNVLSHVPQRLWNLAMATLCRFRQRNTNVFRYQLVAVTEIKNEASYIEEWLEYHLLVGVEHFYVFDNESSDNITEVLRPYVEQGLVTYQSWPGKNQQKAIYNACLRKLAPIARWAIFMDPDEFVQPLQETTIPDFLKYYQDCSQVVMMWALFGSSGEQKRRPGLVIERFTHREKDLSMVGKSIVKPACALEHEIHFAWVLGQSVDEDGVPFCGFAPRKHTSEKIRCNHYIIKSWEECCQKMSRGCSVTGEFRKDYFTYHDRNEQEDESMLHYVPRIQGQLHQRTTRCSDHMNE